MTHRRAFGACTTLVCVAALAAAPVTAQVVNPARAIGVRAIDSSGVHAAWTPTPAPVPLPAGETRATTMIILGAATVITGSLIGRESGRIIMAGGALLGLYGLWRYLQ